ncbi:MULTISPECIES: xanthine dehydrogenase family protein molybdopterin-binding subunit [unclassified Nostoc]|uniref:xanthine dehydrogenase family protein molybdopterin-binding subunit n=1 Tax=unclassified Nostoc TaxID=2593658 RepID=UPI001D30D2BB|nr:xanthine dehydrogenase family protein molybdopterin-binding subunit [Nostoc sp. JL34]MBN3884613.1 xanthine dehydrogenase family protein molybdopterin-binding subunit [Nostoc sp. JL34]
MENNTTTRRSFLKASGAVGAGLFLGFYLPLTSRVEAATSPVNPTKPLSKPNAFIRILPDNTVTIIVHKVEMGQGVYTSLPMILVEELEADWDKIRIESAPVHPDYDHTVWKNYQGTGASTSISSTWDQLRLAGATAREMLIAAAAITWDVSPESCIAAKSYILHPASDRRLSFGELADRAAQMPVPENVTLKKPSEFKLIGKPIKRLDTADKVKGKAVFGIDVQVPGMLIALIARPPVFGSRLQHFEAEAAKAVAGVKHVVVLPMGIAVVADSFWTAKKGRDALTITWNEGPNAELSSEGLQSKYADLANSPGLVVRKTGEVTTALDAAAKKLQAVYETPYLAHAPMEPLNCVADVRSHSCDIWTGTQMHTTDQQAACAITGLKPEQVQIHTTLLGGSFGRRSNPHGDYVKEAVQLSQAIGKPVKVIWTREDDIRGGYYRPVHYSKIAAGLDKDGNITAWSHRLIGESIGKGTPFEKLLIHEGIDHLSIEGADHPYPIPNQLLDYHPVDNGVPVLWWRSVGHSFTAFVVESFLDELATAAGRDPLEFRLAMLGEQPRHRTTLELAAEKAGWGRKLPVGLHQGLALHKSFGSTVAQIAEVSVTPDGQPRVHRVVCAVDCGIVVNPDTVRAQMESGIVYGLSAALYGEITFKDGRVQQSNFHDYPVLRMNEMPKVEVYIVQNTEKPSGVGEISTPPIAPAVCNAIFAATGKRIRQLPISA